MAKDDGSASQLVFWVVEAGLELGKTRLWVT
jgi:hypothetical protein